MRAGSDGGRGAGGSCSHPGRVTPEIGILCCPRPSFRYRSPRRLYHPARLRRSKCWSLAIPDPPPIAPPAFSGDAPHKSVPAATNGKITVRICMTRQWVSEGVGSTTWWHLLRTACGGLFAPLLLMTHRKPLQCTNIRAEETAVHAMRARSPFRISVGQQASSGNILSR